MPFNGTEFGAAIVDAVTKSIQPLRDRIDHLEKQLAERVSVAGAHIDREGALVLILSNGTEKNLGVVTQKGEPGTDGKNCFDLTGFDASLADDGRTILLSLENSHQKASAEITLPVPVYRGTFADGFYKAHDTVTHQGSLWIALSDTETRPGSSPDWRLTAKRGRDAR